MKLKDDHMTIKSASLIKKHDNVFLYRTESIDPEFYIVTEGNSIFYTDVKFELAEKKYERYIIHRVVFEINQKISVYDKRFVFYYDSFYDKDTLLLYSEEDDLIKEIKGRKEIKSFILKVKEVIDLL